METRTCYAGAIEALSSYLYDPTSKSRIEFDKWGEVLKVEKLGKYSAELVDKLDSLYKKHGKAIEVEKSELETVYLLWEGLRSFQSSSRIVGKTLYSKLK